MLCHVDSSVSHIAGEKGIGFDVVLKTEVPEYIKTDPTRLRQCLLNLSTNAIKFTEKGSVTIDVSLEDKADVPFIRFDVIDTGIGIPASQLENIFTNFSQAEASTTRKFGGTGLGLAISKQLTGMLGGYLTVISEEGKGSAFSLVIPVNIDISSAVMMKEQEWKQTAEETETTALISFTGRILVTEDDLVNQKVIRTILEKAGLEVTIANDGKEAIDMVTSRKFDLILMDMQMPNMNGCEATRRLRKQNFTLPIIALTANVIKSDVEECLNAGCDEFQSKPINRKSLFEVLAKYLKPKDSVLIEEIKSVTKQVDELTELASESHLPQDKQPMEERVIQWSGLVECIGNDDEKFIKEIIDCWLEDNQDRMEKLAKAIETSNADEIQILAHTIKGSAATITAGHLRDAAYMLETAGKERKMENTQAMFAEIEREYKKVKSYLSQPYWIQNAKELDHNRQHTG